MDRIRGRPVGVPGLQGRADIGHQASPGQKIESGADFSIKTHSCDVEKVVTVGGAVVDRPVAAREQGVVGRLVGLGDTEVAAKAIAGSAGN